MTNEEAINVLNKTNPFMDNSNMQEYFECIEISIEALEENSKLKAEIDGLNTQIAELKAEGVGISHDVLALKEENEQSREYGKFMESKHCNLLKKYYDLKTKNCESDKEIERLRYMVADIRTEMFSKEVVLALKKENDKIKAENERLSGELKSEREWCSNTRIEEFDKKKQKLKGKV